MTRAFPTGRSKDPAVKSPRIVLADDNAEFLEEAITLLDNDFDIVAAYPSGKSLLQEVMAVAPEVIILDMSLGDLTGIEVVRRLRQMGSGAKVIILTVHENPDFIRAAFAAGASAYVFKSALTSDLPAAIEAVARGDVFISQHVA